MDSLFLNRIQNFCGYNVNKYCIHITSKHNTLCGIHNNKKINFLVDFYYNDAFPLPVLSFHINTQEKCLGKSSKWKFKK